MTYKQLNASSVPAVRVTYKKKLSASSVPAVRVTYKQLNASSVQFAHHIET